VEAVGAGRKAEHGGGAQGRMKRALGRQKWHEGILGRR
jgi:hypothetical protein